MFKINHKTKQHNFHDYHIIHMVFLRQIKYILSGKTKIKHYNWLIKCDIYTKGINKSYIHDLNTSLVRH